MFGAQKFFGQVWESSGKIPSHPKNLPAPTPMRNVVRDSHYFFLFLILT